MASHSVGRFFLIFFLLAFGDAVVGVSVQTTSASSLSTARAVPYTLPFLLKHNQSGLCIGIDFRERLSDGSGFDVALMDCRQNPVATTWLYQTTTQQFKIVRREHVDRVRDEIDRDFLCLAVRPAASQSSNATAEQRRPTPVGAIPCPTDRSSAPFQWSMRNGMIQSTYSSATVPAIQCLRASDSESKRHLETLRCVAELTSDTQPPVWNVEPAAAAFNADRELARHHTVDSPQLLALQQQHLSAPTFHAGDFASAVIAAYPCPRTLPAPAKSPCYCEHMEADGSYAQRELCFPGCTIVPISFLSKTESCSCKC
eukprot:gnl/Spiro4/1976_TR943_c0_g2_i1.p1 gnl/Spiro4/1976_TR943_c0_g2~~gnl/Spiro4/1976_TR943_c0_g2_i1.p1  ORF type:complete len:324 (-),score=63.03 gnl/Spiro4/1976_TR943_c0_g2_i1:230-1171(-)